MGYALVVKDADFSAQSIGRVTYQDEPTPVIGGWMFGLATDVTLDSRINKTKNGVSAGPWIFAKDYSPSVSFSGKTISKIFIIPKTTDWTLKVGICNDVLSSGDDFTSSKEEKASILITQENVNTQISITPFTVPAGKTVYFESSLGSTSGTMSFLNCTVGSMIDGIAAGIPGTLSNYYNENIRTFNNWSIAIDFYCG